MVTRRFKKTVFFVTHDVDEALILSERIFVLGQGKNIIFDTKVKEEQRIHRGERLSESSYELRNKLVDYINKDVADNKN